jgi:hypothetical protein
MALKMTKRDFEKKCDVKIEPAGLFIHNKLNYLAASPDALIGKDAIVEIKCPQSIKEYTPEEAVNNKKLKYMIYNDEKLILKKNNCYYF